jgi:DNA transformation protein and related proteins
MDAIGLEDLFAPFARVTVRRIFGGLGVYAEGLCFALVMKGDVYLKVDTETQERFREVGSHPFVYAGATRPITVAYWRLPESAHEDEQELVGWCRLAVEAARRALAVKTKRRPRKASAKLNP